MRARADAMAKNGAARGTANATRAQKRTADAADEEQRRRAALKARRALEDVQDAADGPEADIATAAADQLEEQELRRPSGGGIGALEEEELLQG